MMKTNSTVYGFYLNNYYLDIALAGHTLYPEFPRNLGFWTSIYTKEPFYKDEGKDFDPRHDDLEDYLIYNAKDSSVTLEIAKEMIKFLKKRNLWQHYLTKVQPLHYLYLHIDRQGFRVDEDIRTELIKKYCHHRAMNERKLYDLIGTAVNVNSPKQMKELIYGDMNIKPFTFKGQPDYGTGQDIVSDLLAKRVKDPKQREILNLSLEQRRVNKTLGPNYLTSMPDYDGRMRTSTFIVGTETSRTSTQLQKPPVRPEQMGWALQLMTKHGEIGSDIRRMCIADPGEVFIQVDSAQAEARVVCLLSDDPDTLRLMDEIDFHAWTASFCFGGTWQDHSKEKHNGETAERFIGKSGRHAFNLMVKAPRMARMVTGDARKLGIDIGIFDYARAEAVIQAIHTSTPKVRNVFQAGVEAALQEDRTLHAPQGGKRVFFERWGNDLLKEACAYIPQYTITTNTKIAMLDLRKEIPEVRIIIEAHDGFLISVKKEIKNEVSELAKLLMERPISFERCTFKRDDLTIPAEIEEGENYKEMR